MNSDSISDNTSGNFYKQAGAKTTSNFLITSFYNNSSFYSVGNGRYWSSSTSAYNGQAFLLSFDTIRVKTAEFFPNNHGYAVRCLAK